MRREVQGEQQQSKLRPVLTVFVDAAWRGLEKNSEFKSLPLGATGWKQNLSGLLELTEDATFAQRTGVLQKQPGVHTLSVVLVETRQHPQTLGKQGHNHDVQ